MSDEKKNIEAVLTGMFDFIEKEEIEMYQALQGKVTFQKDCADSFFYSFLYPLNKFISGLIKIEISPNSDIEFIYKHSQFIEHHFRYFIVKFEGNACCADKIGTILRRLEDFYKTGNDIVFDYNQEITYHLPKKVFKTHSEIINFYTAIKHLYYGNPEKYLQEILNMKIDEINQEEQE